MLLSLWLPWYSFQIPAGVLNQAEQAGSQTPTVDANGRASALTALAVGRLQRFTRSGFKRSPTEQIEMALALLT